MKAITKFNNKFLILLVLLLALFTLNACTASSSGDDSEEMGEMDHEDGDMDDHDMEDMDHEDDEHEHEGISRIPNQDGATISIVSPADGTTTKFGDQIIVEIATENFELDDDGSHWHIYINGSSWGMVMGQNREQALTGIEPGEHEIAVYMAIGTHEEFEDGDKINITVEE